MDCVKVPSSVRKVKKKQLKDESDRIKQAEKKKRRLEKALATSAAIRSQLEMKKQKKKEEQQRLDDEGAAIAEAVALNVLLGEDTDDACKVMLNKDEGFNLWDCACDFALPYQEFSKYSLPGIGWASDACRPGCNWTCGNSNGTFSSNSFEIQSPYFDEGGWETTEISADCITAQAVSSLRIAEDEQVDTFFFNQIFRG